MLPSSLQPPLRVRVLRSGSAGNAILVEAASQRFLIDAGLPGETILRELDIPDGIGPAPRVSAILITHEHDDHLKGAAAVARAHGATVLLNEPTLRAAGGQLAAVDVDVFVSGRPFRVGPLEVTPFVLPHDAAEPVGFALALNGTRVAVAMDLGEVTGPLIEHARGADFVVLEANHDLRLMAVSSYPWFLKNRIVSPRGHLSNDGAARAAVDLATGGAQTIHLVHLSEVNNLAPLARDVVGAALRIEGIHAVQVEAIRPNAGGPWWSAAAPVTTAAG
jgi:phosphoribosyl 1,2-cyclic phosphodiesterase